MSTPIRQTSTRQTPTRETIVQLLSHLQDGKEVRAYLNRFSAADQTRFAVIKIGGAILQDALEETAEALAFLQTVGLTPVVIHGGGPQLDAALDQAKIDTPKVDGLRVTDAATMDVARRVFTEENIRLVSAVRAQGVAAEGISSGVIEADYLNREKYGLVGEPVSVHLPMLEAIVSSGAIPILTCLGTAPGGQLVNVNGDAATRAVVAALQPIKVVFLTGTGGLLNKSGELIHAINLATEYERLLAADWVKDGMRYKLEEIKKVLETLPRSSSVSMTRPADLLTELFTHKGAGTLVRLGEVIKTVTDKSTLDPAKTKELVERAFARPLAADWWDKFDLLEAEITESYRAGAFLTRLDRFTYLDKFAVSEDARGEGLSRTIWRRVAKNHPSFYWRSRTANPFNAFYHDQADGSVRRGNWTVFWIGETTFANIEAAVAKIERLPADFDA
ncbi:MAG: acetylglutamate kinase [Pseudomonadota bacterium]